MKGLSFGFQNLNRKPSIKGHLKIKNFDKKNYITLIDIYLIKTIIRYE